MSSVTFRRGLTGIVLLALAVRLVAIAATPHFNPQTDALDYDRHAVALVDTGSYPVTVLAPAGGPTAFRPPAFPLALSAAYAISGTGSPTARWRAGRILEALLGALAVALLCLVARRAFGDRVALLSGLIAAVYPPLVLVGSSLMSESLYVPLVLGAVLAALIHRESRHRWRWALAAGALIGLAALTRSNGVAVAVPLCVLVWTERPRWSPSALRAPAALAAAAALMLVPWTVRNAVVLHAFVPVSTQSGFAFAGTFSAPARDNPRFPTLWTPPYEVPALRGVFADRSLQEPAFSQRLRAKAGDFVSAHPAYVLEVLGVNLLRALNLEGPAIERFLAPYESYPKGLATWSVYAFWLVGALALAGAFTAAARRVPLSFWALPAVIVLSSLLFLGLTRYRAPADPFLIMLASLALLAARDRALASR